MNIFDSPIARIAVGALLTFYGISLMSKGNA